MEIRAAPDILKWLTQDWSGEVEWDAHNARKLEKHGFLRSEVEAALVGDFVFGGEAISDFGERRFVIFAGLSDGRHMTIAWTQRADRLRPISCRRSRREEEKIYAAKAND